MKQQQTDTRTGKHLESFRVRVWNYRSYQESGWIEFRPLTILIGPNCSGKTGLISGLLALKQTLEGRDLNVHLKTDGPLVNLGLFRDLVYNHDPRRKIRIAIDYHRHSELPRRPLERIGAYQPGGLTVEFQEGKGGFPVLSYYELRDIFSRKLVSRKLIAGGHYSISLPPGLGISKPKGSEKTLLQLAREDQPSNFLFEDMFFRAAFRKIEKPAGKRRISHAIASGNGIGLYVKAAGYSFEDLQRFFRAMQFVGPLRDHPQRHYEVSNQRDRSVGTRGEYAARVIFSTSSPEFRKRLRKWMNQLGIARDYKIQPLGGDVFSLQLQSEKGKKFCNISDTGFGSSQVLPLLVQGLILRKSDVMIAEQPEIHLNPKLQTRLCDFFVELANNDRSVIIESHSEHMLLRLRTLIAEGKIAPDKVALYFIDQESNGSTVTPIAIDQFGVIRPDEWPRGFFDEGLGQAFALAHAQQRRKANAIGSRH